MSLRRFLSLLSRYHLLNVSSWGKGISTPRTLIISPFRAGHQLNKLISMLKPFFSLLISGCSHFLYNPFCIKILLIKDQTFCLLERKCPVTYKQKTTSFEIRMTDSNPLQEANSIKSLSPKGASLLKLCQSLFADHQFTFVLLSLVDVPSAF